jgi:hypothetical protein
MLMFGMLTWPALAAPADANAKVPTIAKQAAKWRDMVFTSARQPVADFQDENYRNWWLRPVTRDTLKTRASI